MLGWQGEGTNTPWPSRGNLEFIETSIELDSEDPDYHEALGRCFRSLVV